MIYTKGQLFTSNSSNMIVRNFFCVCPLFWILKRVPFYLSYEAKMYKTVSYILSMLHIIYVYSNKVLLKKISYHGCYSTKYKTEFSKNEFPSHNETGSFSIIPTSLPSAPFELDVDTSVFIHLIPFLRYKLKFECTIMKNCLVKFRES